jgi:hypothetical protein
MDWIGQFLYFEMTSAISVRTKCALQRNTSEILGGTGIDFSRKSMTSQLRRHEKIGMLFAM